MADRVTAELTDGLTGDQIAAVTSLVDRAARKDGYAALNEAALLGLRHGDRMSHVMAFDAADLVGYAQRRPDESAALVVDPRHRRRGVGSHLLQTLITRTGRVRIWATGDTPAAQALATRHGLTPVRTLLIMKRSLSEPVPVTSLPAGVTIRAFAVGTDEPAWVVVNARAFASHPEQGAVTRADLARRMAEPWFDPAGFFVAVRGETMIGFHWTKQHGGRLGEVYVLGVDPDAGVRGLGRPLLAAGLTYLAGRGNSEVELYVEADNARAIALYRGFDFVLGARDVMYVGGSGFDSGKAAAQPESLATMQDVRRTQETG